MDISIIIPTKDRNTILFTSLKFMLEATQNIDVEILVIDNSSRPAIQFPPELNSTGIKQYKNPGNRNSVFASRNFGASIAQSDLLLFVDDDILVTKESIEYSIQFHKKNSAAALNINWEYPSTLIDQMKNTVSGRYLIKSGVTTMKELYGIDRWQVGTTFESKEVASYFLSIKKVNFQKIGGYDERHLHEGTDIDIINRLKQNDIKMYINSSLTIFHNEYDRIEITNWMQRKKRFGEICSFAGTIETSKEHQLYYSRSGKFLFLMSYRMKNFFFFFIRSAPQKTQILDFFHFRLLNLLTGAHICKGYYYNRA